MNAHNFEAHAVNTISAYSSINVLEDYIEL